MANENNVEAALALYRHHQCLTLQEIADTLGTTYHTIHHVCKTNIPAAEYKALSAIRYSRSKEGEKNPMYGKTGDQHHNWLGLVDDGYGYLTCIHNGKRQFVHRIVMAQALGMEELPGIFEVHHIDENPKNNNLDNLALVTPSAHKAIHFLQRKDSKSLALKRSRILDAMRYTT